MRQASAVAEITGAADGDQQTAVLLELSYRISPAGETIVDLGGELDIASAEAAVSYVRAAINRHRRPVIVDLTALTFCDARGLAALVRMAGYAEQMGCAFQLSSPSRSLVKIMRITGLDRRFLARQVPRQTAGLRLPLTVQTGSGTKLGLHGYSRGQPLAVMVQGGCRTSSPTPAGPGSPFPPRAGTDQKATTRHRHQARWLRRPRTMRLCHLCVGAGSPRQPVFRGALSAAAETVTIVLGFRGAVKVLSLSPSSWRGVQGYRTGHGTVWDSCRRRFPEFNLKLRRVGARESHGRHRGEIGAVDRDRHPRLSLCGGSIR